jgi:hypothetical protein
MVAAVVEVGELLLVVVVDVLDVASAVDLLCTVPTASELDRKSRVLTE